MKHQSDDRDQDQSVETALIIHPLVPSKSKSIWSLEDQLEEVAGLAGAIGLEVIGVETVRISRFSPGYLLGKGNREAIAAIAESAQPDVIILNYALSPVQQRNLERLWKTKVIDRTGLILEIFGERAQTAEGKIQVELAAMEYQRSRLVRSWTHLERQRGGAGFMGGPGETQIETDRRLIGERIVKLKKELEDVSRTRDLARKSRERVPYPMVALVGYTNAGKSTLFNHLTGADVMAEDMPFATLDPTMRKMKLPNRQEVIVADTVGFIADLPTHLVAAFRATLEQVQYADVILHVRDMARPDHDAQRAEVIKIMEDLGIDYEQDSRVIEVWNKIDVLSQDEQHDMQRRAARREECVAVSALTGQGGDNLLEAIEDILAQKRPALTFRIALADGEALAWLYQHGNVFDRSDNTDYIEVRVEIDSAALGKFTDRFKYTAQGKGEDNEGQLHKAGHGSQN